MYLNSLSEFGLEKQAEIVGNYKPPQTKTISFSWCFLFEKILESVKIK